LESYVPVMEKKTVSHGKEKIVAWTGRILNLSGYSIKGDTREEIENRLTEKARQLNKLKQDDTSTKKRSNRRR
jgi:hypothetical protein